MLYPSGRYNLNFDICAAVLAAVLLFVQSRYVVHKLKTTRSLMLMETLTIIQCVFEDIFSVSMNNSELFNPQIATAASVINYCASILATLSMYFFVVILTGQYLHTTKIQYFFSTFPADICLIFLLVPVLRDTLYTISADGKYISGCFHYMITIYVFIYIILIYKTAISYRNKLGNKFQVVIFMQTLYFVLFIISIMEPYLKALNFVMTVMLIVYVLILDDEETEHWRDNSMIDELSGIKNRNGLRYDFEKYINKEICVAILDIDKFKKFNDKFGHKCGDEVIKQCSSVMTQIVGDSCYRYGGDEFLIILSDVSVSSFRKKLDAIEKRISEIELQGIDQNILITCGYSSGKPYDEREIRDIINKADDFLYKGKKNNLPLVGGYPE